jgi:Ribbon-helix-helix protein, copG family
MIRVQIYLDEEDDRWLEEQARMSGTTKSAMIRDGIRALRAEDVPPDQDPLMELIGLAGFDADGVTDGSVNHDRYLMQREFERNHPDQ